MTNKFIVAVDGPAGSGKSSVCRQAASRLGFGYLDTGAGYRAFALHWLLAGKPDPHTLLENFDYSISTDPAVPTVLLAGRDVTSEIRLESTSEAVASIAGVAEVRELQGRDARLRVAQAGTPGVIVEGRDITTVVFPDAPLRLILTASAEERQRRRGMQSLDSDTSERLLERDARDLRVVDFMNPAPGVELLDTTNLDLEGSVQALTLLIESCRDDV